MKNQTFLKKPPKIYEKSRATRGLQARVLEAGGKPLTWLPPGWPVGRLRPFKMKPMMPLILQKCVIVSLGPDVAHVLPAVNRSTRLPPGGRKSW